MDTSTARTFRRCQRFSAFPALSIKATPTESHMNESEIAPQTQKGPVGPFQLVAARTRPPRATRPGGRRRPSLPQGRPCSTLGAGGLNFRVRYGTGCAPAALAAGPRGALRRGRRAGSRPAASRAPWGPHSASGKPRGPRRPLGPCERARRARTISGARLSASPRLHLRPIHQVVSLGPYRREGSSRGRLPA